jgi:phage terminase small subunit
MKKSANPALTPKQQYFCRAVASGCTMSDAYREAYSAGRMKPATINREAHTLMAIPKITTRVEALQRAKDRAVIVSSLSDRERVLTALRDFMVNADADSAKIRATELLGKSVGLFKDVQVQEVQRSPEEIRAELKEVMAEVFEADSAVH